MISALPSIPRGTADLDYAAMSEMGMVPEGPVVPIRHYGAIAYAPTGKWGKGLRYTSQAGANQAALAACGLDTCKVLISFRQPQCGAIAYDGSNYQGGSGFPLGAAQEDAINKLGGGRIVNWACNS
ncbi:DUF4189 domain-containing protein [Mycobacterium szulgai]|nr:DUF4189 domain-containing protein [Mycobacterium szulgai]